MKVPDSESVEGRFIAEMLLLTNRAIAEARDARVPHTSRRRLSREEFNDSLASVSTALAKVINLIRSSVDLSSHLAFSLDESGPPLHDWLDRAKQIVEVASKPLAKGATTWNPVDGANRLSKNGRRKDTVADRLLTDVAAAFARIGGRPTTSRDGQFAMLALAAYNRYRRGLGLRERGPFEPTELRRYVQATRQKAPSR